MQNLTGKTVAIMISLIMIISIGAMITQLPKAAGAIDIQTWTFINVAPNPCGVGQTVTVDFWLAVPLQTSAVVTNFTVQITNPDGAVTVQGPYASDVTGGTTFEYAPTMLGTYTFIAMFNGQTLLGAAPPVGYGGDYDEPSNSTPATLDVTSTPASSVPFTPLPTAYWQTPVNSNNVENWAALTGPWLGLYNYIFANTGMYNASGPYNPYTTGPTTAHILWTLPWCVGGVAGDGYNTEESGNYYVTSQYQPKFAPVVISGILYSTWFTTSLGTAANMGIRAINLYNGQTMWIINTTNQLKCGMQPVYETINQYGVNGPWIITTGTLPASDTGGGNVNLVENTTGTDWNFYDGLTGAYCFSIVNGTSAGFLTTDANGNLIMYYENTTVGTEIVHPVSAAATAVTTIAGENERVCAWNATLCFTGSYTFNEAKNTFTRFELGIMYSNPSIPNNLTTAEGGVTSLASGLASISPALGWGGLTLSQIGSEVIVASSGAGTPSVGETPGWLIEAGFSQADGSLLWIYNRTETPWTRLSANNMCQAGDGYFIDLNMATDVMNAYNIYTGILAWTNTLVTTNGSPVNPYDDYGIQNIVDETNGIVIFNGLGGDIWGVNMTNGDILWWTNTVLLQGGSGTETPYGIWPTWVQWNGVAAGQNDLVYISEGHEYTPPLFRGAQVLCLNMTTGALLWKDLGFDDQGGAVAYGIYATYNSYDGQIYAYGQGPSATTVTAPSVGVTTATPIVISGTVLDVSAGASQEAVKGLFPNGLPCVSDASQEGLMNYAYEQQPLWTNITGVPVTLTAIDPNGNFVTLGTTTTIGASGYYSLTYTPDIPGNYTVTATFEGSGAYYSSSAVTSFYAGSPPPTPAPTSPPVTGLASQSSLTLGIAAAAIAIIIAIAIVGILLLRKQA